MPSKKAVIFGSRGQLGVELARVFYQRRYAVTGFDRAALDITDSAAVRRALTSEAPSVVLNPAAYNQVDQAEAEPVLAYMANGLAVRNIAVVCRDIGAQLVHFSSDYVFDGAAGRVYTEEDEPHPIGAYAVSKYAGELYARAYLDTPLIIRTSAVFGPAGTRTARGNFVELMLKLAASGQPIRVVEDFTASPTYAPALAERTADLIERHYTGLFHIGGGTPMPWYQYARLIFQIAGLQPDLHATTEKEFPTAARRPKFSALSNTKMESLGIAAMPCLEDALGEYMESRKDYLA